MRHVRWQWRTSAKGAEKEMNSGTTPCFLCHSSAGDRPRLRSHDGGVSQHSRPALLEAVVDPFEPPMPAKVKAEQALHFAESLARGEPNRKKIVLTTLSDKVRKLI